MIVVVGRPGLDSSGRLARPVARIAMAAAGTGARVEIVGSVGDDADGDHVALELAREGIGHAALLRDPAGTTPRLPVVSGEQVESAEHAERAGSGERAESAEQAASEAGRAPHLDAADVSLGLSYLADCQVLVVAEPVGQAALAAAADAAAYHHAAFVVVSRGEVPGATLPDDATVLELPDGDVEPFSRLVGLYAAHLDSGRLPADAWHDALASSGWEQAAE